MIFKTERLRIRELVQSDLDAMHKMQSNPNVMIYTDGKAKTLAENKADLSYVIDCYTKPENNFWVWAIERKQDNAFIGTCAIVKGDPRQYESSEDEIGYRFLEKYWGNGYGTEITKGLITYAFKNLNKTKLIAVVDELNIASVKILEKQMSFVKAFFNEKDQSNDRKYNIKKEDFLF